jgi:hypothetical protein
MEEVFTTFGYREKDHYLIKLDNEKLDPWFVAPKKKQK